VHRIGRTARAGATGVAISLCDAEEAVFLRDIEKLICISLPVTEHPSIARQIRGPLKDSRSRHATRKKQGKNRPRDDVRVQQDQHEHLGKTFPKGLPAFLYRKPSRESPSENITRGISE
jgi:superfamily II DNA/RNA helicase